VVLMLLLAVLMVSNVKYPRLPPVGLRSWRGILGLAVHLIILAGGIFAPSYFLFPLGLFYMLFGLVRALLLGLSERREPALAGDEQLALVGDEQLADADPNGDSDADDVVPLPNERRVAWGDRRRESSE
jgi:hypothetical protein